MNAKQKRANALKAAQQIVTAAEKAGRDLTRDEQRSVREHLDEARALKAAADQIERGEKQAALLAELTSETPDEDDDELDDLDPDGMSLKAGGSRWTKTVVGRMASAAKQTGVKALLSGELAVPAQVDVVQLPSTASRLLDLIPRKEATQGAWSYLRQTVRENNAAPVADNATKPTSRYEFKEIEARARVIAHLSEPFPLRFLEDVEGLADVLDAQMLAGVKEEIESQIVNGSGEDENFTGIVNTSGVTDVAFLGDELRTIRRARTLLAGKGETVNGWVLNPEDAEALELMREDGETGGFLLDSAAFDTIFGERVPRLVSPAVPKGTAIAGDWQTVRLRVRTGASTLAATQAGDLFDTNRVKLRSEGRFEFEVRRPQAMAVVHLEGGGN